MSTAKTYRVGLVGCGGMGRHHLRVLRDLAGFEIAAVCDVSPEALHRAGEEYGVAARYDDFGRMYDEARLDIVTVATQTRHHHAPTVAALQRGISVMCEKPMAMDLLEADEMVAAAQASGAKLAIHQQNHVHPGLRKAQEMVRAGVIGEVVLIRGRNKAGRKSGNEFMEMGTHITDMMMCFGGEPQWCAGTVCYEGRLAAPQDVMEAKQMSPRDRDSGLVMGARAVAHYGFAGGVLGEIHFFDFAKTMNANYGVDVIGTEGQLAVRVAGGIQQNLWHLPRPMEGTPAQASDWQLVELGGAEEEPIATMYRELARALETNTEPPSSGVEGRRALEMILAIYQSHKEGGRRVELPLPDRRHPLAEWRASANGCNVPTEAMQKSEI